MLSRSSRAQCAAVAIAAAALAAAGCSASRSGPAATSAGSAAASSPAASLTAAKAVQLAAQHAERVTSFAADLSVLTTGIEETSLSGTIQERTQPSPLAVANLGTVSIQGQTVPGGIQEIIDDQAIYLKMSELSRQVGKPWVKLPVSEIAKASGINLGQLFQQSQDYDPLVRAQMLVSSTNVRKLGTATIDGVQTIEYAGSYPVSAGLARLPASVRAKIAPQIQAMGLQTETFHVWLDHQQQVRKLVAADQGSKEQVTSTMQVTATNEPVSAAVPPASQTATVPAGALG